MEIIKRGTPPGEEIYRGTCEHCDTIAEAKKNELTKKHEKYDYGCSRTAFCADCPVCDRVMYFKKKKEEE